MFQTTPPLSMPGLGFNLSMIIFYGADVCLNVSAYLPLYGCLCVCLPYHRPVLLIQRFSENENHWIIAIPSSGPDGVSGVIYA